MKPGRHLASDSAAPLAGVRLARGGPVLFSDPGGHDLAVGQVVVVGPSRLTESAAYEANQRLGIPRRRRHPAAPAVAAGRPLPEGEASRVHPLPLGEGWGEGAHLQPPADRPVHDEGLATVVFIPGQLLENEAGASASIRVLRLATPQDVILFGRREAGGLGFTDRARAMLTEADPSSQLIDAWLSGDQARFTVVVGTIDFDAGAVARRLEHELGLPVELRRMDPDAPRGTGMIGVSGVLAAGLVPHWTDWLAEPGVEPTVRPLGTGHEVTPREFIDRLFPPEERSAWERPRRPRS